MKKADKLNLLANAKGTDRIHKFMFDYDDPYCKYFYVLDYSDKLMLGLEENDFILDGFHIRKISDIKKAKTDDDLCSEINAEEGLLDSIEKPDIDLSSWQTVFESLQPLDKFIIVENEKDEKEEDFFYLGYIKEIEKSHVIFTPVDADGEWQEDVKIPYSRITSVTFGDRYSTRWQEYLTEHNMLPKSND